jgi:hypothetical protein
MTPEQETIPPDILLATHPYFEQCRMENKEPALVLRQNMARTSSRVLRARTNAGLQWLTTTMKKVTRIEIQFLLPGGQTLVIECMLDMSVEAAKSLVKQKSRTPIKSPDHYYLKTPGAGGILSEESEQM